MKKIISLFVLIAASGMLFSQIVITNKTTLNIDDSAILKLDTDDKGVLFPRIGLSSNRDVTSVPNPQDADVVFNSNSTPSLPQTVTFFNDNKWNALYDKEQLQAQLDLVSTSSVASPGNIRITGFTPGAISLGTGTTNWVPLGITDSKTITRTGNSLAFTVEGMAQLDRSVSEFFEYAIGVFVDDKLAAVRKYHKINEPGVTCSWHKFILNGVISNLSTGNHTIKVMARNIASTSNSPIQSIVYGGVAQSFNTNTTCTNMSDFLSRIVLSTTIVETIK